MKTIKILLLPLVVALALILLPKTTIAQDSYLNLDDKWSYYFYGSELIIAVPPSDQTQDRIVFFTPKTDTEYSQTPNTKNFGQPSANNKVLLPPGCEGAHIDIKQSQLAGDPGQNSQQTFKPWLFQPEKNGCDDEDYWSNQIQLVEAPNDVINKAKSYNSNIFNGLTADGDPLERTAQAAEANLNNKETTVNQCSQALSPFGWILCPATDFADNFYSLFKQLVNNLLFFESDKYQDNGLYDSWRIMVTLANTVLVLVAIVIIAAQIFNFEFISAYTVKKALPRLVVAAILIQLSWFMVTSGIQIVNAIGTGLYWLLIAPFTQNIPPGENAGVIEIVPILAQGSTTDSGLKNLENAGGAFAFVVTAGVLGGLAVISGMWLTLVIAAVGVLISLAVAIVVLILRESVLIVLIVLAPLAIAFWILPGTNSLWSMWWKTFTRLLMMYPLIMLLFAGGTISAILLSASGSNINKIFAIIAYFIPIFLIGTTYKFAGSAFASMANFTSKLGDKAKGSGMFGLRDRAKFNKENSSLALARKQREAQRQERGQLNYANKMTGNGLSSSFYRRRSGIDAEGRKRAEIRAGAMITAKEEQDLKDSASYASFRQSKILDSFSANADGTYDTTLDKNGKVGASRTVSKHELKSAIRAATIGNGQEGVRSINGVDFSVDRNEIDRTALTSMQYKDNNDATFGYVHSETGAKSLNALGSTDMSAYKVLEQFAPNVAKGEVLNADADGLYGRVTDGSQRGYSNAVANYGDIAHERDRATIREAIFAKTANAATRAEGLADLSALVRSGKLNAAHFNELRTRFGSGADNLGLLLQDSNATLVWDPAQNGGSGGISVR